MEIQSLINAADLPQPFYSSGVLPHRDKNNWQAQVCVGLGPSGTLMVWIEYREGFSQKFDVLSKSDRAADHYKNGLDQLVSRGYITDSVATPDQSDIEMAATDFLNRGH